MSLHVDKLSSHCRRFLNAINIFLGIPWNGGCPFFIQSLNEIHRVLLEKILKIIHRCSLNLFCFPLEKDMSFHLSKHESTLN